ncbi:MAG TPA: hypothetical protein VIC57_18290 [Candidatus Dormibacteraeota bacterium]
MTGRGRERTLPDRLHAIPVTDAGDLALVRHHRDGRRPYHTLPGGRAPRSAEQTEAALAAWLAGLGLAGVRRWSLVHVEERGGHRELVCACRLPPGAVEAAGATARHERLVVVAPSELDGLDVHNGVAPALRRVRANSQQTLRGV